VIEKASVLIFTVEYLLRIWSCSALDAYKNWTDRLKFMLRPMMLVDLFAILPFYVVSMGVDLRSIRILRIFRLFRILKLGKYSKSAQIMFQIFKAKKEDLAITILLGLILIFVASFLVYLAEHDAQPENFYGLTSAIWWALATLTPGPAAYDFVNP